MTLMEAIPARLYLRVPFFGSRVVFDLVEHLFGLQVEVTTRLDRAHLIGTGGMLRFANENSLVWGAGLLRNEQTTIKSADGNVFAVRGCLSRDLIRTKNGRAPEVAVGDPTYLVSCLYERSTFGPARLQSYGESRFRVGICPHYVDLGSTWLAKFAASADVCVIEPTLDPIQYIDLVNQCEYVLSSSLDGLVVAESLQKPNCWIKLGKRLDSVEFQFADWFSTTSSPQETPRLIRDRTSIDDVVGGCELHDSKIDVDSLIASFDHEKVGSASKPINIGNRYRYFAQCRNSRIPAFFISFNRGEFLYRAVRSFRNLDEAGDVIVHDNGSTDPFTRDILRLLDLEGARVVYGDPIEAVDDLNLVDRTVSQYFESWAEPVEYVVSDCDIDISSAAPDALTVYKQLLDRYPGVKCVGPMLRIHDIPLWYPHRNSVFNRHVKQFWHKEPTFSDVGGRQVAYQEALVDTTFALHRRGESFRRLKNGIRVYEPFEARHLDWYLDDELSEYTGEANSDVAHWGLNLGAGGKSPIAWDSYFRVVQVDGGMLRSEKVVLDAQREPRT